MSRIVFGLLGLVMALVPKGVLETYEAFALENPGECTAKSWTVRAIRAEGIAYAALALAGGRGYRWLMNLVGAVGVVAILFPRRYLGLGAGLVYERPDAVRWNGRFVTSIRGIGAILVLLAIRAKSGDGTD